MSRSHICLAAACLSPAVGSPAPAQQQPWSPPNGAVTSTVISCDMPTPYPLIAADDFQFGANSTIYWNRWWGVVCNAGQLNRPYYITVYSTAQAGACPNPCNFAAVLAQWCLIASRRVSGTDCRGRTVSRFQVGLPAPGLTALANTKYWMQISGDERNSFILFAEDFHW